MEMSAPVDPGFREVGNTVLSANAYKHYQEYLDHGLTEETALHLATIVDKKEGLF